MLSEDAALAAAMLAATVPFPAAPLPAPAAVVVAPVLADPSERANSKPADDEVATPCDIEPPAPFVPFVPFACPAGTGCVPTGGASNLRSFQVAPPSSLLKYA